MATETIIPIVADEDVLLARHAGRALATDIGFDGSDLSVITTAISELAHNIMRYAVRGEIEIAEAAQGTRKGIRVIARDTGPGIADIERAMQDGFSTGQSLGLGLPGTRRLMDDFEITSTAGNGTTVMVSKWKR